jgi:hypothetical protein
MADYRTGNFSKCHNVITVTLIWLITVSVMRLKCHDVITGRVTGLITILVIF